MRIVFLGTPDFAVASLEILVQNNFKVVAVITAPDKPQGRGKKMLPSPVKSFALEKDLAILQPTNLKDPQFLEELKTYQADIQVVVAFRMLPEAVWNMPPLGTFNLHASLLPQYRGAAPINWAIINGEKITGITTFFLKHEIDTGRIIMQEEEPIHPEDDAGTLYERLMKKGAQLVLKTMKMVQSGKVSTFEQMLDQPLRPAPKIFRENCKIDFSLSAEALRNFIRGLAPYPGAWTLLDGKVLKIYKTEFEPNELPSQEVGQFLKDEKGNLWLSCQGAWLKVEELQMQGKKRMKAKEFLRGYNSEQIKNLA